MIVTREEMIKTRIALLKQMNNYIINNGDEDDFDYWITYGVPDCPSEEDYKDIAEDKDLFAEVCCVFGNITL